MSRYKFKGDGKMPAFRAGTITKLPDGTVESEAELPAAQFEKLDGKPAVNPDPEPKPDQKPDDKKKKGRKAQED